MMISTIKGTFKEDGDTKSWKQIELGIDGIEVVSQRVKVTMKETNNRTKKCWKAKY